MRIATLQFNPQVGEVEDNIRKADTLLERAGFTCPGQCDLLVLPEMAFSGYNFPSLASITPYLEPTGAGPSASWARRTAARLGCIVTVGYPEIATAQPADGMTTSEQQSRSPTIAAAVSVAEEALPTNTHSQQEQRSVVGDSARVNRDEEAKRYNSTITVDPSGKILAHYRKTHLYYTDETWASENAEKFLTIDLSLSSRSLSVGAQPDPETLWKSLGNGNALGDLSKEVFPSTNSSTTTTFGICMDLNPHMFTASWSLYELATHALFTNSSLLVVSMAWCTQDPSILPSSPSEVHTESLSYWIARLKPLVENPQKETIVVMANRCGREGDVSYVGSSWVGKVGKGEVKIWGYMGFAEEGVLSIDTDENPKYRLAVAAE